MPTYDFFCVKCPCKQDKFFQMKSAPRIIICPECHHAMARQPGAGAGIIFKGSGFYQTDYKNRGKDEKK